IATRRLRRQGALTMEREEARTVGPVTSDQPISDRTPLGWIGTGLMGASMCGHLIAQGHPMTVFTRSRARAEALLARGACWADSPRQVAAAADVVFLMVGTPVDVREVVLGPEGVL